MTQHHTEIKERTDGLTPIHMACHTNNSKIVRILLKHGANPNIVNKWENHTGVTTMHIAAMSGNKVVMKLLIEHGFNLDKLINQKMTGDEYPNMTVFLILCMYGNVRCLSYLSTVCNSIDFGARTQFGRNGLHLAVANKHLDMVKFLLKNVYTNETIRQKILKQRAGNIDSNMTVGEMAVENLSSGSSHALSIFQILMKYGCNVNDSGKPRIDSVVKVLSSVCIEKEFFEHFELFKSLLSMYLEYDNISNLENFYRSSTITRDVVESIFMEITDKKYGYSIQYEWVHVITAMLNAYISPVYFVQEIVANGTAKENPKKKQNLKNSHLYAQNVICSKNHPMIRFNLESKNVLCMNCGQLRNKFHFVCCKCCEYICEHCATILSQQRSTRFGVPKKTSKALVASLKEKKFEEFVRLAEEYPNAKRIILDVCVARVEKIQLIKTKNKKI